MLIAKDLAVELNTKIINDILIKQKNNKPQSELNKISREQNVKDVYKLLNKDKIINKKILLIDDIYTTGSTVNECSKILKQAGAEKVDIYTLAKD